ncbi:DNA polymerase III delta subunit [Liberibacter crescens BT-1]|uniref:DNA polymerase III subunit delta n=1 Tax=Liberibacter crescens (strain BT-1) TaxID=1215343 RepID=L0ETP3_LIBCB|nr:DNA polymerase III subunit delta [Liberibacter crescens]AGA63998.1 DNA polymerase III delta subunit [Liberibacter crescens BT-1]AMC12310.1 hypothetical protein RL73_00210 [Liberibacter crescens]
MIEIKSYELEKFILKNIFSYYLFIIYGPDRGLISETTDILKESLGISYNNPFSFINLNLSEIQKEKTKFLDEVNSTSLFNEKKIIIIKDISTEKFILEYLEHIIKYPPEKNKIIITTGEFKKDNPIRKITEKVNSIVSISCYNDDIRILNSLIDKELLIEKAKITTKARQILIKYLGGDRIASRNEIRKLLLYCSKKPLIEESDVIDIIGDCSIISIDDAVDSLICGNTSDLLQFTKKIFLEKIPATVLLQACLRKFQLLYTMRIEIEYKNLSVTEVLQKYGKNIFFKRKAALQKALKIWKIKQIKKILYKIDKTIEQTRKTPTIEKILILQSLLSISQETTNN